jgi:microcystin-dependent protein
MMAKRCGCASDTCSCHIAAGDGISIAGVGTEKNPFRVTATVTELDAGVAVEQNNVEKVHLADRLDFRGGGVAVTSGGLGEAIVTITTSGGSGATTPTGSMVMFAGPTAPTGWLLCDGTSYLNSAYPDLAAVLGIRFGGDGTHFNVPNMVDRFPVGVSATKVLAAKGGSASKNIGTTNLPPHGHTIAHTHTIGAEYFDDTATGGGANRITDIQNKTGGGGTNITPATNAASTGSSGNTGSGTALDVTPPYLSLAFVIKT